MEIVIVVMLVVLIGLAAVNLVIALKRQNGIVSGTDKKELDGIREQQRMLEKQIERLSQEQNQNQSILRRELNETLNGNMKTLRENNREQLEAASKTQLAEIRAISDSMTQADKAQNVLIGEMRDSVSAKIDDMSKTTANQLKQFEERFRTLETTTEQKLSDIRSTVSRQLSQMAEDNNNKLIKMTEDNNRQLEKIRGTVDEKLQETLDKKISESFRTVSERLEQVYKGLGEMQNIAQGVGDLKNVLSNVKTRGILGEIQLGAILSQILAPEQYEENVAVVPGSSERVEFAVKLPGPDDRGSVYLPIDSKFNGDRYAHLQEAYEHGTKEEIAAAKKELETAIKKCAKDIKEKYISPPSTTQFAIMFLPFEGLYAEVVGSDLVTVLQKDYNVNVAGPSTMAAMLNSLQMGFRTLAIQKRSGEVWKILGAVKTEFASFSEALEKTQKHIQSVEKDLDTLVGVRTRQINRKLSSVEMLESSEASALIGSEK